MPGGTLLASTSSRIELEPRICYFPTPFENEHIADLGVVTTGVDKWSSWGPKEDALSARVKMVNARVEEAVVEQGGGAVQSR